MPEVSLVTASFVTRELGFGSMTDWSQGDTATQEFFAPSDTYPERIDRLLQEISELGFRTVDLWGAHLHYTWATVDHFDAVRGSLQRHGIEVNSLAAWCHSAEDLEGFCRVANEVGAGIIGGGSPLLTDDRADALAILESHNVRFAIENHSERSTDEVLAVIGDSEWLGSCADSGWWAIQGVDPPKAFRELGERILTVHLKDVDAGSGKGVRPGTGSARVEECLETLDDIGYEGAVGIEHEPDGWDPTEDLRAGYEMLAKWAEDVT